jgi:hypothetical protein
MPKLRHIFTAFFAGETSPYLSGRVETEQHRYGLETCENWLPLAEGPLVKRPGFYFVRPSAATASWFTAFRRSAAEEYIVEWSELVARFYTNGGRIETDPVTPYEIATPYTAAEARYLSLQQSFDRQYIDHPAHPPGALRRDTASTFAHEELALLNGPFADMNSDESVTVTASAASGIGITLTASSPIFAAGHVGSLFKLEAKDFSDLPAWEAQMEGVIAGSKIRNEGKAYQAATGGKTGTIMPTHTRGTEWDGQNLVDVLNAKGPYGVKWTYLHDTFGTVRITAVAADGFSATATVLRRLPDSCTTVPSWRWAHSAFSEAAGWPSHVTLFKGRQLHFMDQQIVGSVVGDYGGGRVNFATHSNVGVLADDLAFRRTIPLEDAPLWIARSGGKLLMGTATRELAIGPINASAAFSGSNIEAEDQSFYGSEQVAPVQAGTDTIFVEIGGRRLRAADYDFGRDRYDAPDLTAAADHIASGGILQLAHQRTPRSLLYGIRADGQLIVHARSRLEIKGFARVKLGGNARAVSAVAINGVDNKTAELWLLVEREDGSGATVKEVWQQASWRELGDEQEEQFFVDGGVRIEAAAGQTHFSGLDHLAGQDVAVLAAGGVISNMAVAADGSLDLPAGKVPSDRAFVVVVGLAYSAIAVKAGPNLEVNGKPIQAIRQRLVKLVTRVLETVGIKLGVPGEDLTEMIDRPASAAMDAPIPLQSRDLGGEVESDFDTTGRTQWVSDTPTAAVVTAVMLNIDVDTDDA